MSSTQWRKVENEAGYPCYLEEGSGKQYFDHPQFRHVLESLEEYNAIKYSAYRVAFKIYALQKQLRVPPLRISSGVLARHRLSLSESSLSLDTAELEAVFGDIYFAAEKEGLFSGDVDVAVDLLINLLLNVYDKERNQPVRVLAAKTLLIILSEESCGNKWTALTNCAADHNGCVSSRRLTNLLSLVTALPSYLGENDFDHCVRDDVDACFAKSVGMLGVSAQCVSEWAAANCSSTRWMAANSRIVASRNSAAGNQTCTICAKCADSLTRMLKFECSKCNDIRFCEKCYLYDRDLANVGAHKKTHLILEVIDGETKPPECLSFMKTVRKIFFCTRTKKATRKSKKKSQGTTKKKTEEEKPEIFTSTVGKASGNRNANPTVMLQDIITQLESQNRALKELSEQLDSLGKEKEDGLRVKVDSHWGQIAAQINRLKLLKENLLLNPPNQETNATRKKGGMKAFDLFSPIPIMAEDKPKMSDNLKTQPRVLSLDSGNFSVTSKHAEGQPLMTLSGDALKPVVMHATSDSISTVSMNDISTWYNDAESVSADRRNQPLNQRTVQNLEAINQGHGFNTRSNSLCVTEAKYDADLRSVASSNDKMKELNADLDTVLDRLQEILSKNFAVDDSCFDNTQLRETANEMEGLLGTLIRGVEQRATLNAAKNV